MLLNDLVILKLYTKGALHAGALLCITPAHTLICHTVQDPIHYPHGTKFMAPGPMGQCFPIPDDEDIKHQMVLTAENQRKIYRMYNFDYVTKVGALQTDLLELLQLTLMYSMLAYCSGGRSEACTSQAAQAASEQHRVVLIAMFLLGIGMSVVQWCKTKTW